MAALHPDAIKRLSDQIDPAHAQPEGVRGFACPILLRGHWATTEQVAIGVLCDFTNPFQRIELSLLPLDNLKQFYNPETIEQWRFQLMALEERCGAQALPRDAAGRPISPFPASMIFGDLHPFHYRTPEEALLSLRELHTSYLHEVGAKRLQTGGIRPNPTPANQTAIALARNRWGELTLLERDDHRSIYRSKAGLVSMLEEEDCNAGAVLDAAFRLAELRQEGESATVCMLCDGGEAWAESERLIERLQLLEVQLVVNPQGHLPAS